MPDAKTFSYQVDVTAVPYQPETVEHIYGTGAKHNQDYPEDILGREIMFDMVRDAITYVLQAQSFFLSRNKIADTEKLEGADKEFWRHLQEKEAQYRQMEQTIKPLSKA
jgi:hypothetical protein